MENLINKVSNFYDNEYISQKFNGQRRFPNEELCRFMGRNYFDLSRADRSLTNILEVGCGSGSNLWMLAREGFNAKGIDLSAEAIKLCDEMISSYGGFAELFLGSMTDLPNPKNSMHAIVDIFSSNCLTMAQGKDFLMEVMRVLKINGRFFSYFPSSNSDAWLKAKTSDCLDENTLKGIFRKDSPFYGNFYPFRFLNPIEYKQLLEDIGFIVSYLETSSRSYRNGKEYFEFTVVEAVKK